MCNSADELYCVFVFQNESKEFCMSYNVLGNVPTSPIVRRVLRALATATFVVAFGFVLANGDSAFARVVAQHAGAIDPVEEGWALFATGAAGMSSGPVFDDPGFAIDAWAIYDRSSADGSVRWYEIELSDLEEMLALENGWTFEGTLRVVDAPDLADFAIFFQVHLNGVGYSLVFGSEADGDVIAVLVSDFSVQPPVGDGVTIAGGGAGYHRFAWTFDPSSKTTSLSVDGVVRLEDYVGHVGGSVSYAAWGAGGSLAQGGAHYSSVLFATNEEVGDMNCDGFVTIGDIAGFSLALTDPAEYSIWFPTCRIMNGDINLDGVVTVADIGPFVLLLTGG